MAQHIPPLTSAVNGLTRPSASALQSPDAEGLTYGRLRSLTDQVAARFHSVGIGPGDIVLAGLPNSPAFLAVLHATWSLGAVCAPMNPLLTQREARAIIDLVQPRMIVATADLAPGEVAVRWADPWGDPPDIDRSLLRPVVADSGVSDGDRLVLFTSGSTGSPKGVVLTEANVTAGIAAVAKHFALAETDRTLAMLPWSHGHGLFASALAPLSAGGTVVLTTPQDMQQQPERLLATAQPTWMTTVPSQLAYLVEAFEHSGTRVSGVRVVRTASAPLPRALAVRGERVFGAPVVEALGMTETSHQAVADSPSWSRVMGTVGTVSPGGDMQFRLSGENILGGGRLEARGSQLFRCYLRASKATADAMTEDGWFRTGDIAAIEEGGRLRIIGRSTEIVNRGGAKIAPAEVEGVLAEHPDVVGALVTGVAHPTLGQEVVAAVVMREGTKARPADLIQYCQASLIGEKVPGRILAVDQLPALPNGKPSRRAAAALFEATR
ncbi:class I adenylate-forming enzyme family protein [Nocardia sp. NPDC052566]|uniref:class I adenylate-forming enzyme family protein n=1 Tax=Nocardia sp. NPDC052566 TaxID=3364330 RepID=UPI0037CB23EA